jgi:hypothetical protein
LDAKLLVGLASFYIFEKYQWFYKVIKLPGAEGAN